METEKIKRSNYDLDLEESRVLANAALATYENSEVQQRWSEFCGTDLAFDLVGPDCCYAAGTRTYFADYLLCMHRAEKGEPRAIALKERYLLWHLTR